MEKQAVLIIDHGSKKQAANDMIFDVVSALRKRLPHYIVHGAHMELASPNILDGFQACHNDGATYITVIPFMLSPGRHSTEDIPNLCADAAKKTGDIHYCVTSHFGEHSLVSEILAQKALECPHANQENCPNCQNRNTQ